MNYIASLTLEVPDPTASTAFYNAAFELRNHLGLSTSADPAEPSTTGLRGYTLSLVVSQPSTVDSLIGTALEAGATPLKTGPEEFLGLRRSRQRAKRYYLEGRDVVEEGQDPPGMSGDCLKR